MDERREGRDRGQEACAVGTRRRHAQEARAGGTRRDRAQGQACAEVSRAQWL